MKLVLTALAAALFLVAAAPPLALQRDSYFFVGGHYVKTAAGDVLDGQMYVHAMVPAVVKHRYPIVMIHGIGQTGTNFEGTPDGREGWAQYFLRLGYTVYVVDQPARGRSAYHADVDGPEPRGQFGTVLGIEQQFTAPELFNLFPQAHLHTQWPGSGPNKGQEGDPIFDQFFASQVDAIPTQAGTSEIMIKAAGAALLDRIGPAILLTHSQAGAFGWQIADARPQAVKAILAIEPAVAPTIPESSSSLPKYGITTTPITFSPAIHDASDIVHVAQTTPDGPDLALCWTQGEPVRQLPNLKGIPILIVVSQASPDTSKDQCVSKFLTQAGVQNKMIRLPDIGIFGNGHMMMLEKNSDQIAHVLAGWLQGQLL